MRFARELGLQSFKASAGWILDFKKEYGFVSRRITKYVAYRDVERLCHTPQLEELKSIVENKPYEPSEVINIDQSGFNPEKEFRRTLSVKGENVTKALVDSMNKISHSYTLQVRTYGIYLTC